MGTQLTDRGDHFLVQQRHRRGANKYAPSRGVLVHKSDRGLRDEIVAKQIAELRSRVVPGSIK